MPKIFVSKSIVIQKPASEIMPHLNNFRNWIPWSPWLLMEPETELDFAEDNKSYSWSGKRVGAGNMKVLEEKGESEIHYDLNFTKPWKSQNKTSFYLSEVPEGTKVTWTMDSSLPFFMFWMKNSMIAYIGSDYERGLDMLKAKVENGEIPSKLEWKGTKQFGGCKWVGVNKTCLIDDTKTEMPKDFAQLHEFAEKNEALIAGKMLSIYHKWDLVKNKVSYTAAVPVSEIPTELPSGFVSGELAAAKTYNLRHIGAYSHLGNAWSTLYCMHRIKEIKPIKKYHPFEVYENHPGNASEKDLITDIHFAVK